MAFKHGKGAAVIQGGLDLSPYLNSASLSASMEPADVTCFGSTWTSAIAGLQSATLSAAGFYDPAVTEFDDSLGVNSKVLTFLPGGASAIGDAARLLTATATSYERSSTVGDAVSFSWEVVAQGAVLVGQVLRNGEDTNTTTGASKDDTSATATGWTAHLHVGVVDGGSWVVKLEDSANNSDWADVSGGAFTAATGITSERLVSATDTAALRRYVRYTATRTSGTAGDGITFALVYSRTVV
jgi:hypothetical protein